MAENVESLRGSEGMGCMKGKGEWKWRNRLLPVVLLLLLTMAFPACGRIPSNAQGTANPTGSPADQTEEAADILPGPGIATDSYGAVTDAAGFYLEDGADAVTAFFGNASDDERAQMALELADDTAIKLNMDAIWVPLAGFQGYSPEWIDEKTYKDEWGTVFVRSDVSWPIDSPISYPIQTAEDFKNYVCPDPTLPGRDTELRQTIAMNRDSQLAITCGVQGPLTTA